MVYEQISVGRYIDPFFLIFQNGGEFLILANTQKRQRIQEDNNSSAFEHLEVDFCFLFFLPKSEVSVFLS